MNQSPANRKNPSRATCEQIIQRILTTEIQTRGQNLHFKQASDFMSYFESLYPASDSLAKQVQRALKALNMPRDSRGYFVPNKTALQLEQERELAGLLHKFPAQSLETACEMVFLPLAPALCDHALQLLEQCETFQGTYLTVVKSYNGLLFFTRSEEYLTNLLNSVRTNSK